MSYRRFIVIETTSCVYLETRFSKDSLRKGAPKERVCRTSGDFSRNRKMAVATIYI